MRNRPSFTESRPFLLLARLIPLFAGFAVFAGCGGSLGAFDPSYPDSKRPALTEVLARLGESHAPSVVAAYSSTEGRLFAYHLDQGRVLFDRKIDLDQPPFIAGEFIIVSSDQAIRALDLRTGEERFSFESQGERIIGAGGEGERVVIALSRSDAVHRSRLVAYDGHVFRFERPVQSAVGAPLVRGQLIVAPWANQNLSFLEWPHGNEIARLRAIGAVLGHAEMLRDRLIAGQQLLFLMDPELADRPRLERDLGIGSLKRTLPGQPFIRENPYERPNTPQPIALDASLFLERGGGEGGRDVSLRASVYYYAFRNILAGLEPLNETLDWLIRFDAPIVGLRAAEEGAIAVTSAGAIHRIDHHGTFSTLHRFPAEIDRVAIRTGDLERIRGATEEGAEALTPLELFQDRNAQLVPISLLAIDSMRDDPAPQHTGDLVLIAGDPHIAPRLREAAREALAERSSVDTRFVERLGMRENFLEGNTSPPSGPMALAAAAAERRDFLPQLIAHLEDPTTPEEELPELVRGIGLLGERFGDTGAGEALGRFLQLYHANADEKPRSDALIEAARAYRSIMGEQGAALLSELMEDPFTVFPLRSALRELRLER